MDMNWDTDDNQCDSQWFAVTTRSRQERVAATVLEALGVQYFLPMTPELRQWSDRKQTTMVPLFSGYLFVHISLSRDSALQVLKAPGVVSFVRSQAGPLPIPDRQIEDIRVVLAAGAKLSQHPRLKLGDRVRVVQGPLAGVEGILVRANSESRLLISIDMICQSIAVSVSPDDVELVHSRSQSRSDMTGRPLLMNANN
jgi:transcription elongation factor/antiterminator RfaH